MVQYDFSDAASKTFGNNSRLITGQYCLFGGDVNQDRLVDASDMIPVDDDVSAFVSAILP